MLGPTGAYGWLAQAVPREGRMLDLACGSAPMWERPAGRREGWVGLDSSPGELEVARGRGAGPLVRARADALPFADNSFAVVVCSMSLQILAPLPAVLAEVARVLAPGGRLVALIPASGPVRGVDLLWAGGLLAALGRRLGYPNDALLSGDRLAGTLAAAGLRAVTDERRRFSFRLSRAQDAELFLDSLYLPGLPGRRRGAARAWLRAAARAKAGFPVPLRRIIAVRA
ncbi:methyltransferase domain-containing protein [Streptomyces sp. YIM 98790]|uniref:class I SAM-dependent methyltransferase n=1 Tax=Streptomyces sp. YIM 98790 TaxID=2689077 RepID=UPI0014079798|nr:methyltransferase domain-containing protein [Streptomyces sp. YIM 98790]